MPTLEGARSPNSQAPKTLTVKPNAAELVISFKTIN